MVNRNPASSDETRQTVDAVKKALDETVQLRAHIAELEAQIAALQLAGGAIAVARVNTAEERIERTIDTLHHVLGSDHDHATTLERAECCLTKATLLDIARVMDKNVPSTAELHAIALDDLGRDLKEAEKSNATLRAHIVELEQQLVATLQLAQVNAVASDDYAKKLVAAIDEALPHYEPEHERGDYVGLVRVAGRELTDICAEAEKGYANIDGVLREGLARAQATIANVWGVIGGEPDSDENPEVRELEDAVRVSLEYERDKVEGLKEEVERLRVRDSNLTFHDRNVMAVNKNLSEKLILRQADIADLERALKNREEDLRGARHEAERYAKEAYDLRRDITAFANRLRRSPFAHETVSNLADRLEELAKGGDADAGEPALTGNRNVTTPANSTSATAPDRCVRCGRGKGSGNQQLHFQGCPMREPLPKPSSSGVVNEISFTTSKPDADSTETNAQIEAGIVAHDWIESAETECPHGKTPSIHCSVCDDLLTDTDTKAIEAIRAAMALLAVIHRDGGHHAQEVGIVKACEDARRKVAEMREQIEALSSGNVAQFMTKRIDALVAAGDAMAEILDMPREGVSVVNWRRAKDRS